MSYDNNLNYPEIHVEYPGWVRRKLNWLRPHFGDRDRMRVALEVARENVLQSGGLPFGAALFEEESGMLVAVGVNHVDALRCSVMHAEIMALMMAQAAIRRPSLGDGRYSLYASCEPCVMCMSASLYSRVSRVLWSALYDDGLQAGFDPHPVPDAIHEYMRAGGIELVGGLIRDEGRDLLIEMRRKTG